MKNWLCRTLVSNPYYYQLFLNENQFKRALKELKIPDVDFITNQSADANVHFINRHGKNFAFVCIREHDRPLEVYGLLIHEAVHIWQNACLMIGEDNAGTEIEAYAIQTIAQELIWSYNKQKRLMIMSKTVKASPKAKKAAKDKRKAKKAK